MKIDCYMSYSLGKIPESIFFFDILAILISGLEKYAVDINRFVFFEGKM